MVKNILIGIDIGATDTKIGLIDKKGNILERACIETRHKDGPDSLVGRIHNNCKVLLDRIEASWEDVLVAGIGFPGVLDIKRGLILFSPNMKWYNIPILNMVQDEINVRSFLENDANAAAWGEKWVGAGKGKYIKSLVMFTLGTGIGGGVILEDKIWHGSNYVAGELGHIIIEPDGVQCACGGYGCLEAYASATAVALRFKEARSAGRKHTNEYSITAKDVYEEACKGDKIAKKIMDETGRYLGIGIVNIMHIINPDIVVIGGGMSEAKDLLIRPILDEINKRAYKVAREGTKIAFAELGNDAGMIGAAGWALKILETSV